MAIIISEKSPSTPFGRVSFLKPEEKFVRASISTSSKKQDGTYEYSEWNATFVGEACVEKAKKLNDKDRIKITSAKLDTSKIEKDGKNVKYTNLVVFNFELLENTTTAETKVETTATDSDLPF